MSESEMAGFTPQPMANGELRTERPTRKPQKTRQLDIEDAIAGKEPRKKPGPKPGKKAAKEAVKPAKQGRPPKSSGNVNISIEEFAVKILHVKEENTRLFIGIYNSLQSLPKKNRQAVIDALGRLF